MTPEEKAKAYDKAIKVARSKIKNDKDHVLYEEDITDIFPELKENENEKIRKELIETIHLAYDCGFSLNKKQHDKYIAWIEKQGEQKLDDVDNKFIRMRENKPKDISEFLNRLTTVEQEFLWEHIEKVKKLDREEREQKPTWSEEDEQMIESIIQLLYDTKSENCWNCIFIKIKDKRKEITFTSIEKWLKSLKNRIQPKQGEHDSIEEPNFFDDFRKTDSEVEPKFHEGDWVVCEVTGSVYQINFCIENPSNHKYGYDIMNGRYIGSDDVNHYHLWTIQDAKDGDVLVASDGSIFLFKCTIDWGCKHYVALTTDGTVKFNEGLKHFWETSIAVHPATKEQRDILFQKMREEGYEWDAEKKELKEILRK